MREAWKTYVERGLDPALDQLFLKGAGKGSGAPLDARAYFVYEMNRGKVFRDRAFTSRREALEAAGLRE